MITVDAATAINLPGFRLTEGAVADLVVLNQPDVIDALRFHEPPAHVIKNGALVDQTRMRALASVS